MMRSSRFVFVLCVVLAAFAARPTATTVIPPTFEQLVDGAQEIFVGRVVSRSSRWIHTSTGRAIVTLVTFGIDESFKGGLQTQTSVEFLGGQVGDVRLEVVGTPEFRVGDRDVLFVGDRASASPLVGFMYGRFRVAPDPVSGVDSVRSYDGRAIAATADIGQPRVASLRTVRSLSLAEFRSAIVARVRAQGGAR